MHNVLSASAAFPYLQPTANVVDLRTRLSACAIDERQAWEALHSQLSQSLRVHSVEIHIDCETDGLRMRTITPDGGTELRLSIADDLLKALQLLENPSSTGKNNSTCGRNWFLIKLEERDHLYQLDHVQSSSGHSYTLRRLYDAQNPLPQLDQLLKFQNQSNHLRKRLKQANGLILLADVDRVRRVRTARALAQCMTSPTVRILLSETECHPLIAGTNQIIISQETHRAQQQAWQQACDMSYDIIFALEITHDPVRLTRLATENCLVVQGTCASSASKALTQLLASGTRPEAIAQALTSIVVQHEVAMACERCKCPATISHEINEWIGQQSPVRPGEIQNWLTERLSDNFVQAEGCEYCDDTGISGIVLITECFDLTPDILDALNDGDLRYALESLHKEDQFPSQLIRLARKGDITVDHAIHLLAKGRRHTIDGPQ